MYVCSSADLGRLSAKGIYEVFELGKDHTSLTLINHVFKKQICQQVKLIKFWRNFSSGLGMQQVAEAS